MTTSCALDLQMISIGFSGLASVLSKIRSAISGAGLIGRYLQGYDQDNIRRDNRYKF